MCPVGGRRVGKSSPDRTADVSRGRGVGPSLAPGMPARLARRETTLRLGCLFPYRNLPNRRRRDPSGWWCGRGEAVRSLPPPTMPGQAPA
jgi:hypothetical protein